MWVCDYICIQVHFSTIYIDNSLAVVHVCSIRIVSTKSVFQEWWKNICQWSIWVMYHQIGKGGIGNLFSKLDGIAWPRVWNQLILHSWKPTTGAKQTGWLHKLHGYGGPWLISSPLVAKSLQVQLNHPCASSGPNILTHPCTNSHFFCSLLVVMQDFISF
jgi:hypothetical protein